MLRRLLLLTGVLSAPAPLPAQDVITMVIREIAPKSWVISGFTNGNILAAAGRTGILLVDGQSEKRVALADSALRTVSSLPVGLVVNTHYHEDHISGNPWWRRKGADIVGTEALAIEARKDTTIPELEWHRTAAVPEALPNITFRDSLSLTLDGECILVLHPPAAHTGGDAIIWFPARNILHTGDILEREAPPFIDWWAGGSLDGMIAGVDFINARIDDRTILVPGHGTPTNRVGLLAYREMLVAARDRITALVQDGGTRDAIVQARPLRDFEGMLGGERRTGQFVWQVTRGLGAH
jgi:glyoxylase-like metal-dependent hydrolase (beta-lactamase superfamily II)